MATITITNDGGGYNLTAKLDPEVVKYLIANVYEDQKGGNLAERAARFLLEYVKGKEKQNAH
jgi:hypothetical protein